MSRTYTDVAEPRYVERAKHCDEANADFEALVKVVPTEIIVKDGKLYLAHDTVILTGQTGLPISSLIQKVEITGIPASATNGTLTDAQLALLQSDETAFIMFNHEKFYLMDEGHTEGFLTYTHVGIDNDEIHIKTFTITIATKAWVLTDAIVNSGSQATN